VIGPVTPIVVKRGEEAETEVSATDSTSEPGEITYVLGPGSPDWATLDGNKLVAKPGKDTDMGTYLVTVIVGDVLGDESQVAVPVLVIGDEEVAGVTWGSFLGILVLFMVIFLVLAVLISTRMGAGAAAAPEKAAAEAPSEGSEYDKLFEKPVRKVRPVSKVTPERVDVDVGTEEDQYPPPPPAEGPVEVPELPPEYAAPAKEKPAEEPPLPSWMTPRDEKPVTLAEKEVEAPPAAPPEWRKPTPSSPGAYKFQRKAPDEKVRYRGAGPPK
jgi:hypothetical protein